MGGFVWGVLSGGFCPGRLCPRTIQNPYRSFKDFGTAGEMKEKCGKRKRLIIMDAITAGDLSEMHCGNLKHQKHPRKKCKKGSKYKKQYLEDAEEDKKQVDDDGAIFMFEEDYHDSMNTEAYKSDFEKRLRPNLEQNSVIVIDNASCHSQNCPDYP